MKTKEIRRVCGYRIGETVEHEGRRVVIDRFPSRKMVIVKPTMKVCGEWNLAKVPVHEIVRVKP